MARIIEFSEMDAWLRERRLARKHEGMNLSGFRKVFSFGIREEAATRTVIATPIACLFSDDPEVLAYTEVAGAGSLEYYDYNLFLRFRQALGDGAELLDKPGHLFGPDDHADLLSLVRYVLYAGWDCHIVSSSGRVVFRISHDDLAWLYADGNEELDEEWLERFGHFACLRRG